MDTSARSVLPMVSVIKPVAKSVGLVLLLSLLLGAGPVSEAVPRPEPRAEDHAESRDHPVHGHFKVETQTSESHSPYARRYLLLTLEVFGEILCLIPISCLLVACFTSRGFRGQALVGTLRGVGKQLGVAGTNLAVAAFVAAAAYFAFESFDSRPALTNWLLFLCFLGLIRFFPYIVIKISRPVVRLLGRESAQLAAGLLVVSLCISALVLLSKAFVATLG